MPKVKGGVFTSGGVGGAGKGPGKGKAGAKQVIKPGPGKKGKPPGDMAKANPIDSHIKKTKDKVKKRNAAY